MSLGSSIKLASVRVITSQLTKRGEIATAADAGYYKVLGYFTEAKRPGHKRKCLRVIFSTCNCRACDLRYRGTEVRGYGLRGFGRARL